MCEGKGRRGRQLSICYLWALRGRTSREHQSSRAASKGRRAGLGGGEEAAGSGEEARRGQGRRCAGLKEEAVSRTAATGSGEEARWARGGGGVKDGGDGLGGRGRS